MPNDLAIKLKALIREADLEYREVARRINVSSTYISQMVRGKLRPPDFRIIQIARAIGRTDKQDELLAAAGFVAPDVLQIIRDRPDEIIGLVRATQPLPTQVLRKLVDVIPELMLDK